MKKQPPQAPAEVPFTTRKADGRAGHGIEAMARWLRAIHRARQAEPKVLVVKREEA